jgi:hypothetical protein
MLSGENNDIGRLLKQLTTINSSDAPSTREQRRTIEDAFGNILLRIEMLLRQHGPDVEKLLREDNARLRVVFGLRIDRKPNVTPILDVDKKLHPSLFTKLSKAAARIAGHFLREERPKTVKELSSILGCSVSTVHGGIGALRSRVGSLSRYPDHHAYAYEWSESKRDGITKYLLTATQRRTTTP